MVAGLCAGMPALGQDQPGSPYDVNAVRPGQTPVQPPPPPIEPPLTLPETTPDVTYRVSRFLIEFRSEHPQHPTVESLMQAPVVLGAGPEGYTAPQPGKPTTTLRLIEVTDATGSVFSAAGLAQVARGLVEEMNRQGLAGIVVQMHPDDVDPQTGADKRAGQQGDMRLLVWTGVIAQVRTVSSGERFQSMIDRGLVERVDTYTKVHDRIREQSPVQAGELMNKKLVDDYVFRLNRHPGRRVDVVVAPGEKDQEIVLDYLVSEAKQWTVYSQVSNTGTEATEEWRERFGFTHNQLTGNDDTLNIDYITGGFDQSHALSASYSFPLKSDTLRARVFGSYSEYDASEVGFGGESFSGETYAAGAEVSWMFRQRKQVFWDAVAGFRWENVKVTNELFGTEGEEPFAIPYLGVRVERVTDTAQTFAGVTLEYQSPDLAGTDLAGAQNLGRPDVDDEWTLLRFDASHSFYLEPLLSPAYRGGTGGSTALAHEVALSGRGQYAFDNRLIANEEDVVGGMFSVRGYPQSVVAGDSVYIGSLEYRFHWPRTWAVSEPGHVGKKKIGWPRDDFRWAPAEAFGRTDWDLVMKAFVDVGKTEISEAQTGEEGHTLVGAGVGLELVLGRRLSARLDWGVALDDVDDPAVQVDSGDSELHFLLTVMY